MSKKDSTIFYQEQIDICKRHFNAEQFGRLMYALFEVESGNEPEVDEDISVAFEFMALQKKIDREKYDAICKRNRENGKKGGRPKKKEENPKKANGFFENPNENENENENENDNDNDNGDDMSVVSPPPQFSSFGHFENVRLTDEERDALKQTYENSNGLIEKVSVWLRGAKNEVPDHYALCVKFANNDNWPKRKKTKKDEPIRIEDPLSDEEREAMVLDMRKRLNGVIGG